MSNGKHKSMLIKYLQFDVRKITKRKKKAPEGAFHYLKIADLIY